ncbi:hypothetical protein [Pseudomonas sp. GV071]|uniref:hypothetical protein n=1 Tax=Pseudomonas sp. GV071 TaxID=2135754 RepID=UPI000D3585F7|nr:hypothetical protein [Pseudomonas sp. GV071]PTQ70352.1 hypothetical protein C8K61_10674 [Pseudomonas sp. GV071]
MSDMGKSKVMMVGAREVICRELTVAAARNLLQSENSGDLVKDALFLDVRLDELVLFTNLTSADISDMYPSELALVVEGCRAVNPDFFAMLDRLSKPAARV